MQFKHLKQFIQIRYRLLPVYKTNTLNKQDFQTEFPANSLTSTNCSRQYTNQFYTNNMSKESSNLVNYPGKTVLFIVQQIAPSFKNKEPEIPAQSDNKFQQLSEQFPNNSLAKQSSQLSIKQHKYVQKMCTNSVQSKH